MLEDQRLAVAGHARRVSLVGFLAPVDGAGATIPPHLERGSGEADTDLMTERKTVSIIVTCVPILLMGTNFLFTYIRR